MQNLDRCRQPVTTASEPAVPWPRQPPAIYQLPPVPDRGQVCCGFRPTWRAKYLGMYVNVYPTRDYSLYRDALPIDGKDGMVFVAGRTAAPEWIYRFVVREDRQDALRYYYFDSWEGWRFYLKDCERLGVVFEPGVVYMAGSSVVPKPVRGWEAARKKVKRHHTRVPEKEPTLAEVLALLEADDDKLMAELEVIENAIGESNQDEGGGNQLLPQPQQDHLHSSQ